MGNYTPNPSMTQPIYDPTRPFATPSLNPLTKYSEIKSNLFSQIYRQFIVELKREYCFRNTE